MKKKILSFDWSEFEAETERLVLVFSEESLLSGEQKKAAVIKELARWIDDKVKLPGLLEVFDGPAIKFALTICSSWVEKAYQKLKPKLVP